MCPHWLLRRWQVEELEAAFKVLVFEKPDRFGHRPARMRIQPRGETLLPAEHVISDSAAQPSQQGEGR